MEIKILDDKYQFTLRVSAIIYNKVLNRILLFKVNNRDFYLLPGGKVERLEHSINSLKREMIEEIGEEYSKINFEFYGISEEFVNDKGINNHQLNIVYKGIYQNTIKDIKFNGKEGDWINFEWMDINELDNINLYPVQIKNVIKNYNSSFHIIEDNISSWNFNRDKIKIRKKKELNIIIIINSFFYIITFPSKLHI